jgi:hypothetical protein
MWFKNILGVVIDIPRNSLAPGTPVQTWTQDSPSINPLNQYWYYTTDGYIQSGNGCDATICLVLDIKDANPAQGTIVQTWNANGGANQKWTLEPSSQAGWYYIKSQLNGMVLTIQDPTSTGSHLVTYHQRIFPNECVTFIDCYAQLWQPVLVNSLVVTKHMGTQVDHHRGVGVGKNIS